MTAGDLRYRPYIGLLRQTFKGEGGLAAREGLDHRLLSLHGLAQKVVELHHAHEIELDIQEPVRGTLLLSIKLSSLLYALDHVGHDAESMYAMITIQLFDCSVGVGDGRGFVADDHDDHLSGSGEGDDVIGNAGRRIDQQHDAAGSECAEGAEQTSLFDGWEIRLTRDTRRCRNELV